MTFSLALLAIFLTEFEKNEEFKRKNEIEKYLRIQYWCVFIAHTTHTTTVPTDKPNERNYLENLSIRVANFKRH